MYGVRSMARYCAVGFGRIGRGDVLAAVAGRGPPREPVHHPGHRGIRAVPGDEAVTDAGHPHHGDLAARLALPLHVGAGDFRPDDVVGRALREKQRDLRRQRARRVVYRQRTPGLDGGDVRHRKELLLQRLFGLPPLQDVEDRLDAFVGKRSTVGIASGTTTLSIGAPYTRDHDHSVMAVRFLPPELLKSSPIRVTSEVAGAAAATPTRSSSGA